MLRTKRCGKREWK